MKTLFIEYPKCSTCQKAKKWLEANKIVFEDRHIVVNNPTMSVRPIIESFRAREEGLKAQEEGSHPESSNRPEKRA